MKEDTHDSPADASPTQNTLTDPLALRARDAVEFVETTTDHDHEDHYEPNEARAGVAAVGVVADGQVILLVNHETDQPALPYAAVDPGEDYAAAARQAVEDLAGVAVEIDGVERVRRVDHRFEGEDAVRTARTHDVVFRATPAGDRTVADGAPLVHPITGEPFDDAPLSMGWYDELPEEDPEDNTVLDDVRTFLE